MSFLHSFFGKRNDLSDNENNSSDSDENQIEFNESENMDQLRSQLQTVQAELDALRQQQQQETATQSQTGQSSQVFQVSEMVKMQAFYENDPELWFIVIESQFSARKITNEKTRYLHVVANLNCTTATKVKDVIKVPFAEGHYERLKQALIAIYAESGTEKFRKLISNAEMGDQKPSQFLHYMKSLADNTIPDEFIRKLWIQRLPSTARAVLSASTDTLENLTKMADSMWEVSDRFCVNSINSGESSTALDKITTALNNLTKRMETWEKKEHVSRRDTTPRGKQNQSRSSSRSAPRNKQRSDGLCWYHSKHGADAKNCRQPCDFEQKN